MYGSSNASHPLISFTSLCLLPRFSPFEDWNAFPYPVNTGKLMQDPHPPPAPQFQHLSCLLGQTLSSFKTSSDVSSPLTAFLTTPSPPSHILKPKLQELVPYENNIIVKIKSNADKPKGSWFSSPILILLLVISLLGVSPDFFANNLSWKYFHVSLCVWVHFYREYNCCRIWV